ncbi:GNAT family N-acetyltransferase [Cellulomonas fimi]|uniref:GNAT family N-acetyltransferase n=1 Tax=Cellulomonas fimi TaxID=1708 RepID=A0A7Y0LVQ5_CELFI|nr:GNAT family N-acetyltransferase [Cellulomonas fimi]NMR19107.1 GNAT family N-acetyltransferase [Cellulomonas fimi]
MEIRTPRLHLRRWRADDLGPFAELNADPEVMAHFPAPLDRAASDALAARADAVLERDGWGLWALEVTEGADAGAFAGFTGLAVPTWPASFGPCTEVGWRLARWAWGRGYATEAARHAVEHGFRYLGLGEIVSFTARTNARSQAVMERLGMRRDPDGDFLHPRVPSGHPVAPHVLYRLGARTWCASSTLSDRAGPSR